MIHTFTCMNFMLFIVLHYFAILCYCFFLSCFVSSQGGWTRQVHTYFHSLFRWCSSFDFEVKDFFLLLSRVILNVDIIIISVPLVRCSLHFFAFSLPFLCHSLQSHFTEFNQVIDSFDTITSLPMALWSY